MIFLSSVLVFKPKALCNLGKYSTTKLYCWHQHCRRLRHHRHHHHHEILPLVILTAVSQGSSSSSSSWNTSSIHTHCCLPPPPHLPSVQLEMRLPRSLQADGWTEACLLPYWKWPCHVTQHLLVAAEALVPSSLTSIFAFCKMWETWRLSDPVPRKTRNQHWFNEHAIYSVRSNLKVMATLSLCKKKKGPK